MTNEQLDLLKAWMNGVTLQYLNFAGVWTDFRHVSEAYYVPTLTNNSSTQAWRIKPDPMKELDDKTLKEEFYRRIKNIWSPDQVNEIYIAIEPYRWAQQKRK